MNSSLRMLIVLLAFHFSFATHGAETAQALEQIDQYLGAQTFQNSYLLGDQSLILMTEKMGDFKSEMSTLHEVTKTGKTVELQVRAASDNHLIRIDRLTESQWLNFKGNYVRAIVDQLSNFGFKVEIEITDYIEVRLLINQRPRRLSGYKISYTGTNQVGNKVTGELVVTNQLWGPTQIPYRQEIQGNIKRTWSLTAASRFTPGTK